VKDIPNVSTSGTGGVEDAYLDFLDEIEGLAG
jgi:hypothetical protein